jgi:hypothetical protein
VSVIRTGLPLACFAETWATSPSLMLEYIKGILARRSPCVSCTWWAVKAMNRNCSQGKTAHYSSASPSNLSACCLHSGYPSPGLALGASSEQALVCPARCSCRPGLVKLMLQSSPSTPPTFLSCCVFIVILKDSFCFVNQLD